jgi:hypothetical protein
LPALCSTLSFFPLLALFSSISSFSSFSLLFFCASAHGSTYAQTAFPAAGKSAAGSAAHVTSKLFLFHVFLLLPPPLPSPFLFLLHPILSSLSFFSTLPLYLYSLSALSATRRLPSSFLNLTRPINIYNFYYTLSYICKDIKKQSAAAKLLRDIK